MIDSAKLKNNLIEVCKSSPHAKNILKKVTGKNDYKGIAELVDVHPSTCSGVLKKAFTLGLLLKNQNNYYQKTPEFKVINIDQALKDKGVEAIDTKTIKIRKRNKIVDTTSIKKQIKNYILGNFRTIIHPFSKSENKVDEQNLSNACIALFDYLDKDIGIKQLEGLSLRFYDSFANYFSSDRINKASLLNSFSSLVKCFEPYIKKIAAIKSSDYSFATRSLNGDVISKAINFSSNINNSNSIYWDSKPIHESCIRFIYPFRHMEAHEARDYPIYEIEKIIHYMFASIIFINIK